MAERLLEGFDQLDSATQAAGSGEAFELLAQRANLHRAEVLGRSTECVGRFVECRGVVLSGGFAHGDEAQRRVCHELSDQLFQGVLAAGPVQR